jgi:membrane protease YdiL (CAAX protease family)
MSELNSAEQTIGQSSPVRVAPFWHTLGLLFLLAAVSIGLLRMQSLGAASGGKAGNAPVYLAVIACEWALVCYIWLGGRRPGAVPLRDLIGGRWGNIKAVLRDIAVAGGFWVVWTLVAIGMNLLVGPSQAKPLAFLNPRGTVEITLWVLMSLTAGFCEELVYRGYLQRQVHALTGSAAVAVLVQAVIFGVGHWYQGARMVIVITVLGSLFGVLAWRRKSLRPGMISHAWSDILNVIPIRLP